MRPARSQCSALLEHSGGRHMSASWKGPGAMSSSARLHATDKPILPAARPGARPRSPRVGTKHDSWVRPSERVVLAKFARNPLAPANVRSTAWPPGTPRRARKEAGSDLLLEAKALLSPVASPQKRDGLIRAVSLDMELSTHGISQQGHGRQRVKLFRARSVDEQVESPQGGASPAWTVLRKTGSPHTPEPLGSGCRPSPPASLPSSPSESPTSMGAEFWQARRQRNQRGRTVGYPKSPRMLAIRLGLERSPRLATPKAIREHGESLPCFRQSVSAWGTSRSAQ